jgi:tetratricopeptide (TPR) repeat protein
MNKVLCKRRLALIGQALIYFLWIFVCLNANLLAQTFPDILAMQNAVKQNPNDPAAWKSLGLAYSRHNMHQEAISAYKQSLLLNPDNNVKALDYNDICAEEAQLRQLSPALEACQTALQINPNLSLAWSNLGNVYYYRWLETNNPADFNQCIQNHKKALQLNPSFAIAWNNLGAAYLDHWRKTNNESDLDEAIRDFQMAAKFNPAYTQNLQAAERDKERLHFNRKHPFLANPNNPLIDISTSIVLIFIGIFLGIIYFVESQHTHFFVNLAKHLQAQVVKKKDFLMPGSYILAGTFQNEPYTAEYFPGTKYKISFFKITLSSQWPQTFYIEKESWIERAEKALHFIHQVEIKSETSHKKYYAPAGKAEVVQEFLANPQHQMAVVNLFEKCHVKSLVFGINGIEAKIEPYGMVWRDVKHFITPSIVLQILEELRKLTPISE